MASTTYLPTKLKKGQWTSGGPQLKLDTDTLVALVVVTGGGLPNVSNAGVQYISDILATNAELSYAGYARQTLTGVTMTYDSNVNTVVDFSFANIVWPQNASDPSTGRYLIIADTSVGSADSSHPVLGICDPGQTFSSATGILAFTCPVGGLLQFA